jgi:hypothetical protein
MFMHILLDSASAKPRCSVSPGPLPTMTTALAWPEKQKSLSCFKNTSYCESAEEYIFLLYIRSHFRKLCQGIWLPVH